MTNTKKYNELVEKIKELEYWQEIERRRADLDLSLIHISEPTRPY